MKTLKKSLVKEYKHKKAINNNVTIGILRSCILTFWLTKDTTGMTMFLIQLFTKYTEPVRLNRKYRIKRIISKRRNLVAQTNYRRAG